MTIFATLILAIMELLKYYKKNGWSFDILREGTDDKGLFLVLRITNGSSKKQRIKIDAKYLSISTGMHKIDRICPDVGILGDECFLPSNFFVDQKTYFYELNEIKNGDRIELEIFNIVSLLLIREGESWYVADKSERITDAELIKRVEHFETIEEKFGISTQNFSVLVLNENTISLSCEVLGTDIEKAKKGFNLEAAVYDIENKVVGFSSIKKYEDDFEGFEVFAFRSLSFRIPVEYIGKIRIYPTR